MFDQIRIVLVEPSHPGNVGAVARAMKNMGLSRLSLVNPKDFPNGQARARAAGAEDILNSANVVTTLKAALKGCDVVYGASARYRTLERPMLDARTSAEQIHKAPPSEVAILFGRESSGLTNEELSICNYHLHIPTEPDFSSLNLGAAVQVVAYELKMASKKGASDALKTKPRDLATTDQMMGFYAHFKEALMAIGFMDPKQPKLLMERLERLFTRAQLDKTELNIFRGILSRIEYITSNREK